MSRDPWIGTPYYGWAYDDDDEESLREKRKKREQYMAEWAAREKEKARRVQARIDEQLAYEPYRAAARAKLANEHPVLVGGTLVATLLAKLFDESQS